MVAEEQQVINALANDIEINMIAAPSYDEQQWIDSLMKQLTLNTRHINVLTVNRKKKAWGASIRSKMWTVKYWNGRGLELWVNLASGIVEQPNSINDIIERFNGDRIQAFVRKYKRP